MFAPMVLHISTQRTILFDFGDFKFKKSHLLKYSEILTMIKQLFSGKSFGHAKYDLHDL